MPSLLLISKGEVVDRFLLPEGGLGIGRSPQNQIQLKSPSVSERHARIFTSESCSIIKDLNSALGTFVNDKCVRRYELRDNDTILIGSYKLRFQQNDADEIAVASSENTHADDIALRPEPATPPQGLPREIAHAPGSGDRGGGQPAHLVVLDGINEGQRLYLHRNRVVLGKEKRRNLIVEASEQGYLAASVPGATDVRLNGAPLHEAVVLRHNDELTIEDVTLRFEQAELPPGA